MGRQKSGISMLSVQRMLVIKSYKTIGVMGHKIRKAMAHRDAYYRLAGLIEIDDTYFGSFKPGKRGLGAQGKATVVVAVEMKGGKAAFVTMQQVKRLSAAEIHTTFTDHLQEDRVVRTDGWLAYGILNSAQGKH